MPILAGFDNGFPAFRSIMILCALLHEIFELLKRKGGKKWEMRCMANLVLVVQDNDRVNTGTMTGSILPL